MKDFRRLKVWEKAHALTLATYKASALFPPQERHGIASQVRRASSSVAANIAEGNDRGRDGELRHFLNTATGSAVELEYFLLLARDLGMLQERIYCDLQDQVVEVERMISGLLKTISKVRSKDDAGLSLAARSS